jgi:hypothetical protein
METNREKTEFEAENYKRSPRAKERTFLPPRKGQDSGVHGIPKGATYEETILGTSISPQGA